MNLKSAPVTVLLGVVGLVLLTALGWIALIGPAVGAISEADDAATAAADSNATMAIQLAKLNQQADQLPQTQKLAGRLDAMFPPTADQPGFFAQVKDAAETSGLAPDDVTTLSLGVPQILAADGEVAETEAPAEEAPEAQVGDVAVQTVEIAATGTYAELTEFVGHLESMERSFLVSSVAVAADDQDTDALTLTVAGTTFVAPPLGETPRGEQ